MTVVARISLASVVQESSGDVFPSLRTIPCSYEEIVSGEDVKVLPASGVVGDEPITIAVTDTMGTVTHILVENLASIDEAGEADVALSGGPLPVTVPRGQVAVATNAIAGWVAEPIMVTGTAGTPYKVIVLGR